MNRSLFFSWLTIALSFTLAACTCGTPCAPGTKDCPCKAASVCDDALLCTGANTCVAPTTATVQVAEAAARGCEVVLTESEGSRVASVSFKGGVQGAFVREAPRVAVTFVAGSDARIPGDGVEVALSGPASGLTISKASCVDSAGVKLSPVSITVR